MSKSYLRGQHIVRSMLIVFAMLAMMGISAAVAQAGLVACPTTINACGCTIKKPGTYFVGHDLQATVAAADCIDIKSPATLDGQGFEIVGTGVLGPGDTTGAGIGVLSGGEAGPIVVEDVDVLFFDVGIKVLANNVTVEDFFVSNSSTVGVLLDKSNGDTIEAGESEDNVTAGFEILKSQNDTITDVDAVGNGLAGAWITNSSKLNTVSDSDLSDNGEVGVIESCSPAPLNGAICHNPMVPPSSKATITDNDAEGNGVAGIAIDKGNTGNVINDNFAEGNAFVPVLGIADLVDSNKGCDNDKWTSNTFDTANQTCIH